MLGYAGPLQRVVLARTLWLIVAPLLLGLAAHAVLAVRRQRREGSDAARAFASACNVGMTAVVLASAATGVHLATLLRWPRGSTSFLQPVVRGVRIGRLDAGVALWLDLPSAFACAFACVVALGATVLLARRGPHGDPAGADGREWVWIELALAGALVSFLADGLVATALGWTLAAAAGAWLTGWIDGRSGVLAATRSAAALVALLVGASLLFWSLGGAWRGDEYVGEGAAQFAAVRVGAGDDAANRERNTGGGSLTLTSLPGARVFLDDARLPALTSPFVGAALPPGLHAFRIHTGADANDEEVVTEPPAGTPLALVRFGPTTSFREIASLALVRDRSGDPGLAHALRGRRTPIGGPIVSSVLGLWIAAAWAIGGRSPRRGGPRILVAVAYGATTVLLGPFLLVRALPLLALAPRMRLAIAAVGAAILVGAVGRSLRQAAPAAARWAELLAAAPAGVAWMVLGLTGGSVGLASRIIVCGGLAAASVLLVVAARRASPPVVTAKTDPEPPERGLWVEELPQRLGALLMDYEVWVIDAVLGAALLLVKFVVWAVDLADVRLIAAPADGAALRVVRIRRALEPAIGGSVRRAIWAMLVALAVAVVALTLWLGR